MKKPITNEKREIQVKLDELVLPVVALRRRLAVIVSSTAAAATTEAFLSLRSISLSISKFLLIKLCQGNKIKIVGSQF